MKSQLRTAGNPPVSICIASSSEGRESILRLRDLVYVQEQGRLNHAAEVEENVFGEFEQYSTYFIAHADGQAIGTIRVVADSDLGLPCEKNVDLGLLRGEGRPVEFGHFISLPAFRARGLGFRLLREAMGFSVVCLDATHVLADIFTDESASSGVKYFLSRGFRQIGEAYRDPRFNGSPPSMVLALDIKEALQSPERAQAVEEFRRRHFARDIASRAVF